MNRVKYKLVRLAFLSLMLAVCGMSLSALKAQAEPAPSTPNLCYDQTAGTVLECSTKTKDGKVVPVYTNINGQPLDPSKCYIKGDAGADWAAESCSLSVFSQGATTFPAAPINPLNDPAGVSCSKVTNAKPGVNCSCDAQNQCGLIDKYVNPFIKFLSIVVGIVVTIGIIKGGIQYSTSAGDPQKAAAAKSAIVKALTALIAFIFLWSFLEYLIPGGFLNG